MATQEQLQKLADAMRHQSMQLTGMDPSGSAAYMHCSEQVQRLASEVPAPVLAPRVPKPPSPIAVGVFADEGDDGPR
jgi:hypothetical protein